MVEEAETDALRAWLVQSEREPVTGDPARTELVRAVRRAHPDPTGLRSLDAIHLAAALDLGDDLAALVTYDECLAQAATAAGITVLTPARGGSVQRAGDPLTRYA